MNVDVTLGNILEAVVFAGGSLGVVWRSSAIVTEVRALATQVAKLEPHGVTVPLLQQQVQTLSSEVADMRKRVHDLANTLQWVTGQLDIGREPSRPDLTQESPGRYPPRR